MKRNLRKIPALPNSRCPPCQKTPPSPAACRRCPPRWCSAPRPTHPVIVDSIGVPVPSSQSPEGQPAKTHGLALGNKRWSRGGAGRRAYAGGQRTHGGTGETVDCISGSPVRLVQARRTGLPEIQSRGRTGLVGDSSRGDSSRGRGDVQRTRADTSRVARLSALGGRLPGGSSRWTRFPKRESGGVVAQPNVLVPVSTVLVSVLVPVIRS